MEQNQGMIRTGLRLSRQPEVPTKTPVCAEVYTGPDGPFSVAAESAGLKVAFAYEPDKLAREAYTRLTRSKVRTLNSIPEGRGMERLPRLDFLFGRLYQAPEGPEDGVLRLMRVNRLRGAAFLTQSEWAGEWAGHLGRLGLNTTSGEVGERLVLVGVFKNGEFPLGEVKGKSDEEIAESVVRAMLRAAG